MTRTTTKTSTPKFVNPQTARVAVGWRATPRPVAMIAKAKGAR